MTLTWVLESDITPDAHARLAASVERAGHSVVAWTDDASGRWPAVAGGHAIFHGSLGAASRVAKETSWTPGAFCDVDAFLVSTYAPGVESWLLNRGATFTTVQAFVDDPRAAFAAHGDPAALFVRPDSPLKPFSGRVVARDDVSLDALDHGFYYDDTSLPIVLAPAREVGREWRYVVAGDRVVAGSAYDAPTRTSRPDEIGGEPWTFAESVARGIEGPEELYVLDVGESEGELRVVELNPFSGADLYACGTDAIVEAVARLVAVD